MISSAAPGGSGPWIVVYRAGWWWITAPGARDKKIGPARKGGVNYYDRAMSEAERRNLVAKGDDR